jgi:hypothetical protein
METDMTELLDVLRSLKDGMADINRDFEELLARWDSTDNDPADPFNQDLDDIR